MSAVRDWIGILGAIGLVRMFWDAVFKWHDFYDRWFNPHAETYHFKKADPLPGKEEVAESAECATTTESGAS